MNVAEMKSGSGFYVIGGTVQRDASCYVVRQADAELYDGLTQGRFCYVLTPRQIGKSSLMVRTAARLREDGVSVAVLDLTAIGQNMNAEQWYGGLLSQVGRRLGLEDDLVEFWATDSQLSPLLRWMRAIRDVVLDRCRGRVVIFVDEIDSVRSLPFSTDEFFAGIREFYNRRTEDPELERLTFCLLGVATPSDLIRDTRTTPFNIGQRVELNDFTTAEAAPLEQGLGREDAPLAALLKRVLYWTGGHPYLTQRLCQATAEAANVNSAAAVDHVCASLFLTGRAREQDDNLLFVRERILRSEVNLASLLSLYAQVLREKRVADDETNPLVSALRLSGIARSENGYLRVRNRIYARAFDQEWAKANMPDADVRRQRAAYLRGVLRATAVAVVILAMIAALALTAYRQGNLAKANLLHATFNAEKAQSALDESERQRQNAEDQRAETEQQRQEAVGQRAAAEEQRNLAEQRQNDNQRLLYTAHVDLAQQAYETTDIARMDELLASHIPKAGQQDFRSFEWYYLWRLSHKSKIVLRQENTVYAVALSPDGKMVAAGGLDETVNLLDLSARHDLPSLQRHDGVVYSVAFSPDAKILATATDKIVKLWDVARRQEIAVLTGHADVVRSVTFSSDGKYLATGSNDGTAMIWDVYRKEMLKELKGHTAFVSSVMFSPDGKTLATGSYDHSAKLWDVATGQVRASFSGDTNMVNSVAFSPDGKRLATGSSDETVRVWDVATHEILAALKGHAGFVQGVVFSPDGRTIATAGTGSTVTLWDVATVRQLASFKAHNGTIWSIVFSGDGKTLATAGSDHCVRLWGITDDQEERTFLGARGGFTALTFSPDGRILAKRSQDHDTLKLFDVVDRQELGTFNVGARVTSASVALSPRGRVLAAGSSNNTVRLWEVATRKELPRLKGHNASISAVAFSVDGRLLATGSSDGTSKLWDVATGRPLKTFGPRSGMIKSVGFSHDGKTLAVGGPDAVRLWDLNTEREITAFEGRWVQTWAIAFSPDGTTLAIAVHDREVKLWDLSTKQELATLNGHASAVLCLAFSPDGKRLATGSSDRTVRLWDVATGQARITLRDQTSAVTSVIFYADGRTLGSISLAGDIRLWHAATDKEIARQNR